MGSRKRPHSNNGGAYDNAIGIDNDKERDVSSTSGSSRRFTGTAYAGGKRVAIASCLGILSLSFLSSSLFPMVQQAPSSTTPVRMRKSPEENRLVTSNMSSTEPHELLAKKPDDNAKSAPSTSINKPTPSLAPATAIASIVDSSLTTNMTAEEYNRSILEAPDEDSPFGYWIGGDGRRHKRKTRREKNRVFKFHLNDTLFLHVPKSAGGSVDDRKKALRIIFDKCHPHPCKKELLLESGQALINVRDPIDRYHSAFYWKKLLACRREAEANETRVSDTSAFHDPVNRCRPLNDPEYHTTFEVAKGNASKLAELLCVSDTEQNAYQTIVNDFLAVGFMEEQLTNWLLANETNAESNEIDMLTTKTILSVVVEPGFDFIRQIDASLKYLLLQSFDMNENATANEMARRQALPGAQLDRDYQIKPERLHTSKANEPISDLGTCCLAKYFSKEYKLIAELKEKTCKGDEAQVCKDAMQSILDRRSVYLDDDYPCENVVTMTQ